MNLDSELLKPVQGQFEIWQQKSLASGLDSVRASLVRFAADGFGDAEMFGHTLLNESLRHQLLELLLAMIQEAKLSLAILFTGIPRVNAA